MMPARTVAMIAAVAAALAIAHSSRAQTSAFGLGNSDQPVEIFAERGIEWHQNENAYVARVNARAVRGDTTVHAQTLTAYYRKAETGSSGAGANAQPEGGVQIYRVDAAGAVRIVGPSGTAYGDHAVFDVDKGILVMTGDNLRLVTQRETITARDTLEYWQEDDKAVARGQAVAVSDQNRIAADILTAHFLKNDGSQNGGAGKPAPKPPARGAKSAAPGTDSNLDRMYAYGNVVVTTPEEVARGQNGTYNARTGIAVLTGSVKITRDKNQLNGDAAEMNLNTNVSRIIAGRTGSAPPVRALLIPNEKKDAPNGQPNGAGPNQRRQGDGQR